MKGVYGVKLKAFCLIKLRSNARVHTFSSHLEVQVCVYFKNPKKLINKAYEKGYFWLKKKTFFQEKSALRQPTLRIDLMTLQTEQSAVYPLHRFCSKTCFLSNLYLAASDCNYESDYPFDQLWLSSM